MAMTASNTRTARLALFLVTAAAVLVTVGGTGVLASGPAVAASRPDRAPVTLATPAKQAVAVGTGGAVASDNVQATQAGIEVLRHGGNAVDAAVAVAATLGVTDPFVAGIGGGGFLVYYDARAHQVYTIDGRETAPLSASPSLFIDPSTGQPLSFPAAVTSGLSVGVPGTLMTWQQVRENAFRFDQFSSTSKLFLPDGQLPVVGSVFRNPDLAATYAEIGRDGVGGFYGGALGAQIVQAVHHLPLAPGATLIPRPGLMQLSDLAAYSAPLRPPTKVTYQGLDVYSMPPPSSGGITVGESLNILANFDLPGMTRVQALHHYLEATRLAFADRNRYIGDPWVRLFWSELAGPGSAGVRP